MTKSNLDTKSLVKVEAEQGIIVPNGATATSLAKLATQPKIGQPTKLTTELIDTILLRMACGETLQSVCQEDEMPSYHTVVRWQQHDPELKARFNAARKEGAYLIDDIMENIARKQEGYTSGDYRYDELLVKVLQNRKKYANKERFGDQMSVEVTQPQPVILDAAIIYGEGGDGV